MYKKPALHNKIQGFNVMTGACKINWTKVYEIITKYRMV